MERVKEQAEKSASEAKARVLALQAQLDESQANAGKREQELTQRLSEADEERARQRQLAAADCARLEQQLNEARERARHEVAVFNANSLNLDSLLHESAERQATTPTPTPTSVTTEEATPVSDNKKSVNIGGETKATAAAAASSKTTATHDEDIGLISKLNRRIGVLELERKHYMRTCHLFGLNPDRNNNKNGNDNDNGTETAASLNLSSAAAMGDQLERLQFEKDYELIKSQELDLENQKLREELSRLRDLVADNQSGKSDSPINIEMMNQFDALNEEVQFIREECVQLKSLLISRHKLDALKQHNNNNNNTTMTASATNRTAYIGNGSSADRDQDELTAIDVSAMNTEGNEFEVGYNTQKILNRFLENQLVDLKRRYEADRADMQKDVHTLKAENERQAELLLHISNTTSTSASSSTPDSDIESNESILKNEIIKLTAANLVS